MGTSSSGGSTAILDYVAAARHPPGEHTGQTFGREARHAAVQNDDTIFDLDLDLAAGSRQGIAHQLRCLAPALRELEPLEGWLLVINTAQMIQYAVIAYNGRRLNAQPVDDGADAGVAAKRSSASRLTATFATSASIVAVLLVNL